MRAQKGSKVGAAVAVAVPFALVILSLSASALTVTIGAPSQGYWTANTTIDVSGTAGAPTDDRQTLDTSADFAGGGEINVSTASDRVTLEVPPNQAFRYTQDFTGLAGQRRIDTHWTWDLNPTLWGISAAGAYSSTPPSLVHDGTTSQHVTWSVVLPGPVVVAEVSFRYMCQANATLDVWVSSHGLPDNRSNVLSTGVAAQSGAQVNATPVLAGASSAFVEFRVSGASAFESSCSIDDFDFRASVPRSVAATGSMADNFTAGGSAMWALEGTWWEIGNLSGPTSTPPALFHNTTSMTSVTARWAFATSINSATLQMRIHCRANASMTIFVGRDGITDNQQFGGAAFRGYDTGAGTTTLNLTVNVGGSKAAFVRFASDALSSQDSQCELDDFVFTWYAGGNLNETYTGTYASATVDLGAAASLTTADWLATAPVGTSIEVWFRGSPDNVLFSPWFLVANSGASVSPSSGRYIQFRLNLTSVGGTSVPFVDRLGLGFTALSRVEVSVNGGPWAPAAGTTTWNATVALAAGSNNITVRVTDSTGATTQSVVQVWRDTFPPAAPGKPVALAVTNQTSITWTWTPSTDFGLGVDHYLVDIGLTAGGVELGAGVRVDTTSFTMMGLLVDNVRVYATVWAVDIAGNVATAGATSDATLVDRTAPGAPSVHAQAAFTPSASLTWTWSAASEVGSGVASYMVRVGSSADGSQYDSQSSPLLTYSYSSGVSGSTYFLSVAAIDVAGNIGAFASAPGVTVDQAPPASPAPITGPPAVTNNTALTWSWTASTDALSGVDHYFVTIGTAPGGSDIESTAWSATTYTANSLAPGARYFFEVRAVDGAGNAGPSALAAAVLVDDEAPSAPAVDGVGLFVAAATVTLTWNASSDAPGTNASGVDHYVVAVFDGMTTVRSTVSGQSTDIALTDGAHYTVSIAAVDLAGNEGPGAPVSFTSDRTGPLAPAGLKLVISGPDGPTFQASWNGTVDNGSGFKEYRISIGTTPGGTQVANGRIVTGTNERWTGSFDTTYYVTVWAVDQLGNAGPTAALTEGISAKRPGTGGGFLPGLEASAAVAAAFAGALIALRRRK